ncbi:hypothetical protein ABEF93_001953 [Exophiala dermatitidis]
MGPGEVILHLWLGSLGTAAGDGTFLAAAYHRLYPFTHAHPQAPPAPQAPCSQALAASSNASQLAWTVYPSLFHLTQRTRAFKPRIFLDHRCLRKTHSPSNGPCSGAPPPRDQKSKSHAPAAPFCH